MSLPASSPPSLTPTEGSRELLVWAVSGSSPLWTDPADGKPVSVDPGSLGLTARLVDALVDWASFFTEVEGDLADAGVAAEFVGQGFKVAHKVRGELKGSRVHLIHPVSAERIEIIRNVVR